ncbi:hypothetical protein D9615_000929 [Tricholomella constricta]|uniref:Uncharacterized protein n=1 Tax=Tricholomella constricta TaxID=117010 RepID=A0A8H5HKH3_9AGAR|nr:hypothetical protein D9615_000929 [Tricholomella constricta]
MTISLQHSHPHSPQAPNPKPPTQARGRGISAQHGERPSDFDFESEAVLWRKGSAACFGPAAFGPTMIETRD